MIAGGQRADTDLTRQRVIEIYLMAGLIGPDSEADCPSINPR